MIERLDTITRQLGLKLTKDQKRSAERKPVELFEVFISSDMFYVEVVVESNGHVCDVKVSRRHISHVDSVDPFFVHMQFCEIAVYFFGLCEQIPHYHDDDDDVNMMFT